jgi:hypothetical protein
MELGSHHLAAHSCSYTTTYTHCSVGFSPRVRAGARIRAAAEGGDGGGDRRRRGASLAADGPRVVEVTAAPVAGGAAGAAGSAGFRARDAELAMWDKLGAVVRLSYGIGRCSAIPAASYNLLHRHGRACNRFILLTNLSMSGQGFTVPWRSPGDSYAKWPG